MKKIYNKLIILSTVVVLFSVTTVAQIRTFNSPNNGVAGNSSAFIDASSSIGANNSASLGKGILFPKTDLTIFSNFLSVGTLGLPNNYRNYFDGMIVYNTATGQSSIGDVSVEPGFYYYSNPGQNFPTGNVNAGTWKPLGSAEAPKVHVTENEVTETNLVMANTATEKVISITGTADGITTHMDLGTSVLSEDTVVNFRKAIICDSNGTQVLVATGSYDSATNKFVTGNGMMNICLPAANDYKVELYFTSN
jgi:dihydroxyacetone kinase DhaKLM complex PTS-EIIA-like component DhaM